MSVRLPPGGFAAYAQQSAATQALFAKYGRIGGKASATKRKRKSSAKKKRAATARRKPRAAATRAVSRRRRRTTSKRPAHMVKGSAAAKRHMAKLRRMRKR